MYQYNLFDDTPLEVVLFDNICMSAESTYKEMLMTGLSPQQARAALPNATKTEVVMTGFSSDWRHFFDLRSRGVTGAPHPDMKALADDLLKQFTDKEYQYVQE